MTQALRHRSAVTPAEPEDLSGAALLTQTPPSSLLRLMAKQPAAVFRGLWDPS